MSCALGSLFLPLSLSHFCLRSLNCLPLSLSLYLSRSLHISQSTSLNDYLFPSLQCFRSGQFLQPHEPRVSWHAHSKLGSYPHLQRLCHLELERHIFSQGLLFGRFGHVSKLSVCVGVSTCCALIDFVSLLSAKLQAPSLSHHLMRSASLSVANALHAAQRPFSNSNGPTDRDRHISDMHSHKHRHLKEN